MRWNIKYIHYQLKVLEHPNFIYFFVKIMHFTVSLHSEMKTLYK